MPTSSASLRPRRPAGLAFAALAAFAALITGLHEAGAAIKSRHVVLVTADGFRWEEVFTGADESLMTKAAGAVKDTNALRRDFLRDTPQERRAALLPFFWTTLARQGQLLGNRTLGSSIRVANAHQFSYPGYNELLTGVADPAIDSNDKRLNENTNVFEFLNGRPGFSNRVAAVINWGVLPWVLNSPRAGFPVWSAFEQPPGGRVINASPGVQALLDRTTPVWGDVGFDTYTAAVSREVLTNLHPRALYISYGETDDWAHEGRYDLYLRSAHNFDRFVGELWAQLQSMPEYRDQTTLIVTTDHGRGPAPVAWKNHGRTLPESAYIWAAAIGPDIAPLGERRDTPLLLQARIAATVAAVVGEDFQGHVPRAARAIEDWMPR